MKTVRNLIQKFTLLELLQGLAVTGKYLVKRKTTVQFPEEETPRSARHRGVVALRRYPNGEERCIACRLCEATCPAMAITIEAEPREDGSRRTKRFDIDVFKCINCGLCEEACPVDSIVCVPDGRYTIENRGENIMDKQMLLALGDAFEADIANNRYQEESEEGQ